MVVVNEVGLSTRVQVERFVQRALLYGAVLGVRLFFCWMRGVEPTRFCAATTRGLRTDLPRELSPTWAPAPERFAPLPPPVVRRFSIAPLPVPAATRARAFARLPARTLVRGLPPLGRALFWVAISDSVLLEALGGALGVATLGGAVLPSVPAGGALAHLTSLRHVGHLLTGFGWPANWCSDHSFRARSDMSGRLAVCTQKQGLS